MGHVPIELWAVSKEDVLLPGKYMGKQGATLPVSGKMLFLE